MPDGTRVELSDGSFAQKVVNVGSSGAIPSGGGDASAANQATQITAEQAIQATAGVTNGAKVVTDANGTIQQYLRGIVTFLANALGAGTAATANRVTLASDDPGVVSLQLLDNAITPVAAGAATATGGLLSSMQFLTTLPSPTNTQQLAVNSDARGGMIVGGHVASGATDLGSPVKVGAVYNSTKPTFTTGQRGDAQVGSRGSALVQLAQPDGASALFTGQNADAYSPGANVFLNVMGLGYKFNGATWDRDAVPNAVSRIVSAAASTNGTSAKASAGRLGPISAKNNAAYDIFLKFYNKASAPTVGSDTPVWTQVLPALTASIIDMPQGLYFSTGIAYALTKLVADADTTVLVAADITALNVSYS